MERPTLLLADDHVIVADGLRSLLKEEFELVGSVTDGLSLLDAAPRLQAVDLAMSQHAITRCPLTNVCGRVSRTIFALLASS